MKVRIDIDCTPEEARAFFGLPDLTRLHEAALGAMTRRMAEAAAAFEPEQALRAWMGASGEGFDQMMKLWGRMAGGEGGKDKA